VADPKHLRLSVFGGYTSGGAPDTEVWSFNMRLALVFGNVDAQGTFPDNWVVTPNFDTNTTGSYVSQKTYICENTPAGFDPQSYLEDQAEPAVADFISGWKFSSRVQLRGMALYPCSSPSGNSIDGNFARLDYTADFPVGGGSDLLPLENSVVVSWGTERLGPRGKGRIYTPVPSKTVLDADGLLSAGDALDLVDSSVALCQGLAFTGSGLGAAQVRPVVTGPTAKAGQPAYSRYGLINAVRVGHVIDTQRRRRNAEVEDYSSDTVTY
jgi:hypothetical protein